MRYKLMKLRKYYDVLYANPSFFKTELKNKLKILNNILKYFISNKRLILKNKPVVAQIEPTSECNLLCEMCIRKKIGVPIGTMSFENFKKILDSLDSLFKIHLSGQGEPFLNKDLFRMINYANKKGIIVNLNTNATILTSKILQKITKVDIGEIAISIESTNKNEFEKIRKGANYNLFLKNVKNLTSSLKENKKRTIVSFAITILKKNLFEINEFIKLAKKIGITKLVVQTIQEKEDYVKNYNKEAKLDIIQNKDQIIKRINLAKKLAKKNKITLIFDEEKSNGCIWPWRSIYVTWNGYVTACCKILDYRNPYFGNLLTENFWKIWNGKTYLNFRKMLRERKAPKPCIGCSMI